MKKIYTLLSFVLFSFAASAQCSDIFISEVAEGSSNNKYIEFYNGTSDTIDLSDYAFPNVSNAPSTAGEYEYWNTFDSGAVILPNDVYVVAHGSADSAGIGVHADQFYNYLSNGDDGFKLVKGGTWIDADSDEEIDAGEMTGFTVVDVVGDWQARPSGGWDVAGVTAATKDHTLIRKAAFGGNSSWTSSAGTDAASSEWTVMSKDDWAAVGTHSSDCYPPTATEPSTAAADPTADAVDVISLFSGVYNDVTVNTWRTGWSNATLTDTTVDGNDVKRYSALDFVGIEAVGPNSIDASTMEYFTFDAWTADATTYRIKLVDFGADNGFGGGDDSEHEIVFDMPAQSSWTNHTIDLSDFAGLSGKSSISQLIFSALPAAGNTLYLDNIYFSKEPTLVYNVADIADVIMLDADLAATNEDTLYELTGVVYGVDLDGNAGISFTIIDETAGINIFNYNDVDDYVVTEGDEITVKGKIDFYNGLLELFADSILVNSSGNTLKSATQVEAPSEATESDFIVLRKVWITNDTTTMWPNNGNVELTNDDMDTFQIRIDKDIPGIVGMPVEFDTMTITGLGGQYDGSAPYNEGYQIFPRGLSDIAEYVDRSSVRESVIKTRVYPNPTSNNLTVIGTQKWDTYKVFNILGGIVLEGSLSNNNLTVSDLNTGTYIVKLYAGENTGVARFVINR